MTRKVRRLFLQSLLWRVEVDRGSTASQPVRPFRPRGVPHYPVGAGGVIAIAKRLLSLACAKRDPRQAFGAGPPGVKRLGPGVSPSFRVIRLFRGSFIAR